MTAGPLPSWPHAKGALADRLREPGFTAAGLGTVAEWPRALRGAVDVALSSAQRMSVLWGPEYAFFYNQAALETYPSLGLESLGKSYAEVFARHWDQFGPLFDRVYGGEALMLDDIRIPGGRGGDQDSWVTLSITPLRDVDGKVHGLLTVTSDLTERVLAEARERATRDALEIVNRAGAAITGELDAGRVADIAVEAGVALTGAEFGAFFYNVRDESGDSYMLYSLAGAPREAFRRFAMPRSTQVFAPTFHGEGILRSDDITLDPRYGHNAPNKGMPEGHLPVRSYLAVPVKTPSGEVLGGLFYGHSTPAQFSAAAEASLASLAGQAALAMDNARLFHAREREIARRSEVEEQLRALNENLAGRVQAEIAERKQAEAALQQAQKMETIGKLTGGVAHDFNNLLQVISGNLQLLARDVAGNAKAERRVTNALAGVTRGARLASQLLAFGRRQPLEPRVLNIGKFLAGMDDLLHRALGETMEVEMVVSGGLWNSLVDPTQLENAVLNLAINARDAMTEGGKLTIEVGNAWLDDAYVQLHPDLPAGQYVLLAVSDTGHGMTPEVMEQVFEPFFSTKEEGKGSGLGLSMVYGFVKQSGGHVKLYSEPGVGTTVKLYLPRVRKREEEIVAAEDLPADGGSETILVVEDDEEVRATVVDLLSELGYRVLKAGDAQAALTVIESGAAIDLLFTDVVMPGPLASPELARIARRRRPGIGVLFTSGYTENAIVHHGRLDPGVDLLSKPYSREALARKIRQVLGERGKR